MSFRSPRVHTVRALLFCAGLVSGVCMQQTAASDEEWRLSHTEYGQVLYGDDHTSEGFLAPLQDGRIMLLFRLDPGVEGGHVGTDGYIARITYDPGADEWGEVETVFNSHEYDDRNIHGGVTNDGRIVVFFRQYDGNITHGRYMIYSEDNGQTWSDLQTSNAFRGRRGTGRMFFNPDIDKYCMLQLRMPEKDRNEILYSADGVQWDEYELVTEAAGFELNEIAGAWCGDSRIVALIRDDKREHGHPLLQVESHDNGQSWTSPQPTNIPPDQHWGSAPQLIYDEKRSILIALNGDRYSRPNEENSLFVYTAMPEQILGRPENWTLQFELARPLAMEAANQDRPLNRPFYGYPTIAPINEDEYLVVFTENATIDGREQADLYYFRLIFEQHRDER